MPHYRFLQLKVPLEDKGKHRDVLQSVLRVPDHLLGAVEVERMALDSRGSSPHWTYNLQVEIKRPWKHRGLKPLNKENEEAGNFLMLSKTVHIIGAGPCGLAAALGLARKGYNVHVYEQGAMVKERFKDIRHFLKQGKLDPKSNILYGEGGAGAFSDGKLTSRTRNRYTKEVLDDWVAAGADEEVKYNARPHIGTDKLQFIVTKLRQFAEEAGAKFHFGAKFEDIDVREDAVRRIQIDGKWIDCESLIVATGHSARDVYQMLHDNGVDVESKAFAIGFRVEHPQTLINERQYGSLDPLVPGAAEYSLNCPAYEERAGAYSFCMCPGGVLIPCASEQGELATNGMSYSRRSGKFANSGIVVPVLPQEGDPVMAGIDLQRKLERQAFDIGGKNWGAPAQKLESFINGIEDSELHKSSYPGQLVPHEHGEFFEPDIVDALKRSLLDFERKIPGFLEKGLLVSPETRTSSPIRITRDVKTLESTNTTGLFPLGEGAGFAGGIISSAADGAKLAWFAIDRK